jgi:hypothetical protein
MYLSDVVPKKKMKNEKKKVVAFSIWNKLVVMGSLSIIY